MRSPDWSEAAVLSADTSREAEQLQVRAWRSLSSVDRARVIAGASRAARAMAFAGLRERHPWASDRELVARLAVITLGRTLAVQVYPDLENTPEQPFGG